MPYSILKTKLFIPPPNASAIGRPRLYKLLEGSPPKKLTLISAQAGAGKSNLISQYAAQSNRRVAMVSLEEADSQPLRYLAYLMGALQSIDAGLAREGVEKLGQAGASQKVEVPDLLSDIGNSILEYKKEVLLILDDYHNIEWGLQAGGVNEITQFLIEKTPPNFRLIMASREDPALPLARYRVRGMLLEIRAKELSFTAQEAASFLNDSMRLELSTQEIAVLEERTEGWAAGLQMAALSIKGGGDKGELIQKFGGSHRFIIDYLVEEVLSRQSQEVRHFLMHSSLLDPISGPLCDAALSLPPGTGQAMLEGFENANLFLIPLDSERKWYRYHHLFGELLRQRLHSSGESLQDNKKEGITSPTQSGDNPEVAKVYERAGAWFASQGDLEKTVAYYIQGGLYDKAAESLELAWHEMNQSLRSGHWVTQAYGLPSEAMEKRPVLCVQFGDALHHEGKIEESEHWLNLGQELRERVEEGENSEGLMISDKALYKHLEGRIAIARANNCNARGDSEGALQYANQSLDLLPEEDLFSRQWVTGIISMIHWAKGDIGEVALNLRRAVEMFEKYNNFPFVVGFTTGIAEALFAQGKLGEAKKYYEGALQVIREKKLESLNVTSHIHLSLGLILHEQNKLKERDKELQVSLELSKTLAFPTWTHLWEKGQALIEEGKGNLQGAVQHLEEAAKSFLASGIPEAQPIEAQIARLQIRAGNLDAARQWASQKNISTEATTEAPTKSTIKSTISYLGEYSQCTLASLIIQEESLRPGPHREGDNLKHVIQALQGLYGEAKRQERIRSLIDILTLLAQAHLVMEDHKSAMESLEEALQLGFGQGFYHTFTCQGPPIRRLVSRLVTSRHIKDNLFKRYLFDLQASLGEPHAPPVGKNITDPLIEPLSNREVQILRLIAEGLSNQDIAQRLMLSLNTVKSHNKNIFSKMGVERRTEAVALAREIKLVD